jgi:hypothetical protein
MENQAEPTFVVLIQLDNWANAQVLASCRPACRRGAGFPLTPTDGLRPLFSPSPNLGEGGKSLHSSFRGQKPVRHLVVSNKDGAHSG